MNNWNLLADESGIRESEEKIKERIEQRIKGNNDLVNKNKRPCDSRNRLKDLIEFMSSIIAKSLILYPLRKRRS